jgi:nucleotide-binding universal stress UspA family protein
MGPRNRTPWNLIHDQQSSLLNKLTWHHVLEKSKPQINNINRLQAPFQRLLFKSGLTSVKTHSREGDPAQAVMEIVREKSVDAVVVGRRGRGQVAGLLLGSISQKLVTLAPCMVIVVP